MVVVFTQCYIDIHRGKETLQTRLKPTSTQDPKTMTYAEIKTALKSFQAQGYSIPALNSKKEVLENALAQILASIEPTAPEIVEVEVIEPEPAAIIAPITTPEVTPAIINPEPPALTEFREIAKGLEIALIWAIALIRAMIRFSTPYVKKALQVALRVAVYGVVISREWLLPKAELIAYKLGIWGMTIALRLIHSRRLVIA